MKLTTKLKKYFYWIVSIVSCFVIVLSIYYYLGGFNEISVVKSGNNIYNIAGKDYQGRIKNDSLNMIFLEMRDLVSNKRINGELCVINYRDKDLANGEAHQFIGILLGDEISEIPSGIKVREFRSETTFKVGLGMHPLVRPSAEKVEKKISLYADDNGFALENYSMEILYSDNSILVEMFAK